MTKIILTAVAVFTIVTFNPFTQAGAFQYEVSGSCYDNEGGTAISYGYQLCYPGGLYCTRVTAPCDGGGAIPIVVAPFP